MRDSKKRPSLRWIITAVLFAVPIILGVLLIRRAVPPAPLFTSLPPAPVVKPYPPQTQPPSVILELGLDSTKTNQPDVASRINKVVALESAIDSENPDLWTYERYGNVLIDWNNRNPRTQDAVNAYLYPGSALEAKQHQQAINGLNRLLTLVLLKEQADHPEFGRLIREAMSAGLKQVPNVMNFADVDKVAKSYGIFNLSRAQNVSSKSYEQWLSEVKLRYRGYIAAIDYLVKKQRVPPQVLAATKDRVAYITFSGLATELYVPLHTPPELEKLRLDLHHEIGELADWRNSVRTNEPKIK